MTTEQENATIELLINKIEHMLTIVPSDHSLSSSLESHLSSLYYCPPEAVYLRIQLLGESLQYSMGEPNNTEWEDWHKKVYEIWMSNWPKLEDSKV